MYIVILIYINYLVCIVHFIGDVFTVNGDGKMGGNSRGTRRAA